MSPERALVLDDLRFRCPARSTYDLFAATDRSIPSDSLSLAAPLVAGDVQAESVAPPIPPSVVEPPARPEPTALPDSNAKGLSNRPNTNASAVVVRVFGIELYFGQNGVPTLARQENQSLSQKHQQKLVSPGQAGENPRHVWGVGGGSRRSRLAQKDSVDNENKSWLMNAGPGSSDP